MPKFKDLTNQQIENWLFLEYLGNKYWRAKCLICNNEYNINAKHTKKGCSSRCLNCSYQKQIKNICGGLSSKTWLKILKSAEERNIKIEITPEEIWNLYLQQDKKCILSGMLLTLQNYPKSYEIDITASLDRINSNLFYSVDNVQWLHKDVNMIKGPLNQDYFIKICHKIKHWSNCDLSKIPNYKNIFIKKHFNWLGYQEISGYYWGVIIGKASKRKILFNITIDDAWNQFELQKGKCNLTGDELLFATSSKDRKDKKQTASLDRIDSSRGYESDNIQWVHKHINQMKLDYGNQEFINWCCLISDYQSNLQNNMLMAA